MIYLKVLKDDLNLENKITLFHAKIIKDLDLINDDLINWFSWSNNLS